MNIGPVPQKARPRLRSAIFIGFSILLLSFLIESVTRISFLTKAGDTLPPDLLAIFKQPIDSMVATTLFFLLSFVSFIVAGYFVGMHMKSRGLFFGGLVGGLWVLFVSTFVVLYFLNGIGLASQLGSSLFVRENFTQANLTSFVWSVPLELLKAVALASAGGFLADWIPNKKNQPKKPETIKKVGGISYEELLKKNY